MNMKVKKLLAKIFKMKDIIVMESNPDFSDNTKKIFDELIEKKYNKKYKIIWFVNNPNEFKNVKIENVKFISIFPKNNVFKIFRKVYYNFSAKIIIDCNKYVQKVNDEQFRIHLTHGTPLKYVDEYCSKVGDTDFILELSDFFKEKNSELFTTSENKFLNTGFPRNDDLFFKTKIENSFEECKGKKVIVWLPTYRKHINSKITDNIDLKYGIPCIENENDINKLNCELEKCNAIILIKLHPAQYRSKLQTNKDCNSIKFITDEELKNKNITLYKLLANSDALITDYSSVYYDYLLTRKPIGLAINDIKEYENQVGFSYNYYETIKGEYLYNTEDIVNFIFNVSNGIDELKIERDKCMKLYHTNYDGKSTERVFKIIEKYL